MRLLSSQSYARGSAREVGGDEATHRCSVGLARGQHRQPVDADDQSRNGRRLEPSGAERAHFCAPRRRRSDQGLDAGSRRPRPARPTRRPARRRPRPPATSGCSDSTGFHHRRGHVDPTTDDHVVDAPANLQPTVSRPRAEVRGHMPPVDERGRGQVGAQPIAGEDDRPADADPPAGTYHHVDTGQRPTVVHTTAARLRHAVGRAPRSAGTVNESAAPPTRIASYADRSTPASSSRRSWVGTSAV